MAGDRLRLRRSLDPHALVRAERGGDRQHKHDHDRHRPRHRLRHLVRTPAGAIGIAAVVVGATVAVALAASGGSGPSRPAAANGPSGSATPQHPRPSGPPAVPGVNVGPTTLPPPCAVLTQQRAEAAVGLPLKQLGSSPTGCSWWRTDQTHSVGISYLGDTTLSGLASTLTSQGSTVSPLPELGPTALFADAFDRQSPTRADVHEFYPARVFLPAGGQVVTVFLGTSDGHSHTTDAAGDRRRVIELAKTLFPPGSVA